jgi:hypothetical protein
MTVSKKDILAAIDLVGNDLGASVVHRPRHRRYEIRAIRRTRGIDLKWAVPGRFYRPERSRFRIAKKGKVTK